MNITAAQERLKTLTNVQLGYVIALMEARTINDLSQIESIVRGMGAEDARAIHGCLFAETT